MNEINTKKGKPDSRLAFREEGEFWNVYITQPDTMADAVLLGSARMELIKADPIHKAVFIDLMTALARAHYALQGYATQFGAMERIPEHERTKIPQ